jgi:hypothetical protein
MKLATRLTLMMSALVMATAAGVGGIACYPG